MNVELPKGCLEWLLSKLPGSHRGIGFCKFHLQPALTDAASTGPDSPVSLATASDAGVVFLLLIGTQIHGVVKVSSLFYY